MLAAQLLQSQGSFAEELLGGLDIALEDRVGCLVSGFPVVVG